jgi:hypothetical protein
LLLNANYCANGINLENSTDIVLYHSMNKDTTTQIIGEQRRLVTDRHGVKIFFLFSGNICRFDFQTMLIQLVSGLGLLGIATFTTDFLMSYMMPLRKAYNSFKYKSTKAHGVIQSEYQKFGEHAFISKYDKHRNQQNTAATASTDIDIQQHDNIIDTPSTVN